MKKTITAIALAAVLFGMAAIDHPNSNPEILELNKGESAVVNMADGGSRIVKLLDYREHIEPYFESAKKRSIEAVIAADLTVEVNGVRKTFTGGPFRMPTTVNGVALLLNCTRNWTGGIDPDPLAKDIRLEAREAELPWYEAERFSFPVRNYRWRIMNYQHTYLGIAVNQAKLYYHRGEDFGMIPDLEQTLSITTAEVTNVPGLHGDGESNSISLEDGTGLLFRYAHLNAPHIEPKLQPGTQLTRGEMLGLTGNTWNGGPVGDPHLHFEIREKKSNSFRNSFPLIVAAYRASFPGESLPIAGGWRHVYREGSLVLDGSLSLPAAGRKIVDYRWTFSDGTQAAGPKVTRRYDAAGSYSQQLTIKDDRGLTDSDFVEVFVLARNQKIPPPYAWINYYPVRGIHPGTEVRFLIRHANLKNVTIDYGDAQPQPWAENSSHQYSKPRTYIVTVRGEDAGGGPGIFHSRVIVE